jgi:hypothetical protein
MRSKSRESFIHYRERKKSTGVSNHKIVKR